MPRSKTAAPSPKARAPQVRAPRVRLVLRPTEDPDVFLNGEGAKVDAAGILLSVRRIQPLLDEEDDLRGVLGLDVGADSSSPASFLRAVALDPRLPLSTRMSAATSAAPYFDRKLPLALEGGDPNRPIKHDSSVALKHMESLSPDERKLLLGLFEKMGAIPE